MVLKNKKKTEEKFQIIGLVSLLCNHCSKNYLRIQYTFEKEKKMMSLVI